MAAILAVLKSPNAVVSRRVVRGNKSFCWREEEIEKKISTKWWLRFLQNSFIPFIIRNIDALVCPIGIPNIRH